MAKGIYAPLSGAVAKGREVELIANNLANATTPGFKKDSGTFFEYVTELRRNDRVENLQREVQVASQENAWQPGDKSFVEMDGVYTDFRQGRITRTGRPLDVALEGKGLLEVLTPSGVRFTRQGGLNVDAKGKLVTIKGYPVLSRDPKLAQAGNATANFAPSPPEKREITVGPAPISIDSDGRVIQEGAAVASLSIVEFNESQWLEKEGNTFFRNTDVRNFKKGPIETRVHQNHLEASNVNAVHEMTRLIEASRAYESHMQAIKTFQEIGSRAANDIAKGL